MEDMVNLCADGSCLRGVDVGRSCLGLAGKQIVPGTQRLFDFTFTQRTSFRMVLHFSGSSCPLTRPTSQ